MSKRTHNLLWFIPVLLIRFPIMLTLITLIEIGEVADSLHDELSSILPALRSE